MAKADAIELNEREHEETGITVAAYVKKHHLPTSMNKNLPVAEKGRVALRQDTNIDFDSGFGRGVQTIQTRAEKG